MPAELGRGTVEARSYFSALRKAQRESSASFRRRYKLKVKRVSEKGKYGMATYKVTAVKRKR